MYVMCAESEVGAYAFLSQNTRVGIAVWIECVSYNLCLVGDAK